VTSPRAASHDKGDSATFTATRLPPTVAAVISRRSSCITPSFALDVADDMIRLL
jgi:hypothetical protein